MHPWTQNNVIIILVVLQVTKKVQKIPLLVTYYLTKYDDVILCGFWVVLKITSANLCKAIHELINYSSFIRPFESRKRGKEGTKLQKFLKKSWNLDLKKLGSPYWARINLVYSNWTWTWETSYSTRTGFITPWSLIG